MLPAETMLDARNNTATMKLKNSLYSILTVVLLAGGLTACVTEKHEKARLEAEAKVSKTEAEKIALDKVPGGRIKEGELEKEKGKLIWSFDIATQGTKEITEVHVDAITGAVLAIEKETPGHERREKKEKDDDEKEEKK